MKVGHADRARMPAARAEQIARQILASAALLTREEIVAKIDALTRRGSAHGRGQRALRSKPTVAAIGPVGLEDYAPAGSPSASLEFEEETGLALFRLGPPSDTVTFVRGDGVYLRPAEMRDFEAWAMLRETSRAFLTPWEPTWPGDDLTRAAFRRRLRRHEQEIDGDEAYPFLIFRDGDDALLGGLTLGQVNGASRSPRHWATGWAPPMRAWDICRAPCGR